MNTSPEPNVSVDQGQGKRRPTTIAIHSIPRGLRMALSKKKRGRALSQPSGNPEQAGGQAKDSSLTRLAD
jgi:hypothetical protein